MEGKVISFRRRGISANISDVYPTETHALQAIEEVANYIAAMAKMGRGVVRIPIGRPAYEAILKELNKRRGADSPKVVKIHWDGIPVVGTHG